MKKRLIALLLVLCLSVGLLSTTVLASGIFQPSSAFDLITGHKPCHSLSCHVCHPCKDHNCHVCYPCAESVWCETCKKYDCQHVKTLTFVANGGYLVHSVRALSGTKIDLTKYTPDRLGFDFQGWYSDKNLTFKVTSVTLTKDTTVYAKWKANKLLWVLPFMDIPANSYFYPAVCWGHGCGVVSADKLFHPDAGCTRGDMLTFLWRAAGSPQSKLTYMPFTDVPEQAHYYEAVQWALETGITKGTNNLKFNPGATVTRAEVVTFLYRYAGKTVKAENPFTDVAADDWFYDAVLWATTEGITTGTSSTTFSPDDTCTRAQVMTFLYRYFG